LKHNLLSVSQMCKRGYNVIFHDKGCDIINYKTGKKVTKAKWKKNNMYVLNEINKEKCFTSKIDYNWLWHKRLGHVSFENIVKLSAKGCIRHMPTIVKPTDTLCKACLHGKQTRRSFKSKEYSTTRPLELIHIDLYGPTRTEGINGEVYFMLLIDDYTRMTWVACLKKNLEALDRFKKFKALVENEKNKKIKCLRSERGEELWSNEFDEFCEENGIRRQFSSTRTPQQNG
ncbi:hypothetical protein KI387_018494, partial [Taxus chinensis]